MSIGPIDLTGRVARLRDSHRSTEPGDDCDAWEPSDTTVARDCASDGHYRCKECHRFDRQAFDRYVNCGAPRGGAVISMDAKQ